MESIKLTEQEKSATLTCIEYVCKQIEIERLKAEKEYNKFDGYDAGYEKQINDLKESESFYTNLKQKLDKIL